MDKQALREIGFNYEVDLIEKGKCPTCCEEVDINEFETRQQKFEYKVIGLCLDCQKRFLNVEKRVDTGRLKLPTDFFNDR